MIDALDEEEELMDVEVHFGSKKIVFRNVDARLTLEHVRASLPVIPK